TTWTKVSGPTTFTFNALNILNPIITLLVQGSYTFRVTVTDNKGATASDDVNISVSLGIPPPPPPPPPPVIITANAGTDQTIQLPVNTVQLRASASAPGRTIVSTLWSKVSGPDSYRFSSASAGSPTVSSLVAATYTFRVTVKDNLGNSAYDDVNVIVKSGVVLSSPKVVKVNIYGGSKPYGNAQWNDWNVGSAAANNVNSANFKYSDGSVSTVKASLSQSIGVADNMTSFNNGMAPSEVLKFTSYATSNRSMTLTGLTAGRIYTLEVYSSRKNSGNSTIFAIGSTRITVNSSNNSSSKAVFQNLTADVNGRLVMNMEAVSLYSYINGFTLIENGAAGTTARGESLPEVAETIAAEETGAETELYPNPVQNQVVLKIRNKTEGKMKVQVYNMAGAVIKEFNYTKTPSVSQTYIPMADLQKGQYVLRVQVGDWTKSFKFIKL
ncbi:MAG: T9SS type A sorting domain-containing protein, partial [Chitinophagaceae bacterium]